jgi:hypothetical protein
MTTVRIIVTPSKAFEPNYTKESVQAALRTLDSGCEVTEVEVITEEKVQAAVATANEIIREHNKA